MSAAEHEMCSSDDSGNLSDNIENDFDNEEMVEDKWIFPKASDHLGTVLRPGVVRPLSPTLKIHSPESVFPGVAMLYEGFDDMREWRNTIEFVRFFAKKGNMFNGRHHWDMRTKFLEVRLNCMEKIVEDPYGVNRKPVGGFFVRVPPAVQKALEEERRKTALAREREDTARKEHVMHEDCVEQQSCGNKELSYNIEGESCVEEQNNAEKQTEIIEGESNVETKNYPRQEIRKHGDDVGNNNSVNVELSSVRKDSTVRNVEFVSVSTAISNTRMDSKGNRKKIDIWIPNQNCIEDSSMYMCMLESSSSFDNEHALSESSPKVTFSMLQEQRRLQKENIRENIESTEDEKLKRESLQKGLNVESRRETSLATPGTSAECEHFPPSNDSVQDLRVIGKSIQLNASFSIELVNNVDDHDSHSSKDDETVNLKKGLGSKSETLSSKDEEELVLEDVGDKDYIPDVILPSSCKLEHTGVKDAKAATATNEVCGNLFEQNIVERPKQRTLSRLQRLRRRVRNLFSCFARNQVTPVDN